MSASPAPRSSTVDSPAFPPCDPAADGPIACLAAEMRQRWLRGERPGADELLARHPELGDRPEAALALIYEEVMLRREWGVEEPDEALFARFPQWRPRLELLLECDRLLAPGEVSPAYPAAGEALGGFRLLAELGRGARGRVFLATQPALADRPVVLKLTPREGPEHLSLARLQHTHIVPLLWAQDYPGRRLRALCLPYFGGATLADVLRALADCPPARRTGRRLVEALAALDRAAPVGVPVAPAAPARRLLAGASYVEAVCWVGACLADALQYAHERGLLHLDLKPSNVLLTAEGVPMLLDFHLARAPLRPGAPPPGELGGSHPYMPPEQQEAMRAVGEGRPVPAAVDGRADVYALGVILHEALGGRAPAPGQALPALRRLNPRVSVGLSDVLARCVAADPARRYRAAADLAADLRRHLTDRPLNGVANRSLAERWRKWRRRRPAALKVAALGLALLGMSLALGAVAAGQVRHRHAEAEYALEEGRRQWRARGHHAEAVATLRHGLAAVESLPLEGRLADELRRELREAEGARAVAARAEMAGELHRLADGLRGLYGEGKPAAAPLAALEARCREIWEQRTRVRQALGSGPGGGVDTDLLDLAILCADLRVRSAPAGQEAAARREALRILGEAEALFGTSAVLRLECRRHMRALGLPEPPAPPAETTGPTAPRTAWEHCALGRAYLVAGELRPAAAELGTAVRLEPGGLWPNYYRGLCAYRLGQYEQAALAFSVCIGADPRRAVCYYHRALAYTARGQLDRALADYDRALELDPALAAALLNRGMLHCRARRYDRAVADLQAALRQGAEPAAAHYGLAVVYAARHDRRAALANLREALRRDPPNEAAHNLLDRLQAERSGDR